MKGFKTEAALRESCVSVDRARFCCFMGDKEQCQKTAGECIRDNIIFVRNVAKNPNGIVFTVPELNYLKALLSDVEARGEYWGNKAQFWKRHGRVKAKLEGKL